MKHDMPNYPDSLAFRDGGMINGTRTFVLTARFRYFAPDNLITVPYGFVTDGASIPRIFWGIFSPFDAYFPAAVIHDYLYSNGSNRSISRLQADQIFLKAMQDLSVPFVTRWTIYYAVRMFGSCHYKITRK